MQPFTCLCIVIFCSVSFHKRPKNSIKLFHTNRSRMIGRPHYNCFELMLRKYWISHCWFIYIILGVFFNSIYHYTLYKIRLYYVITISYCQSVVLADTDCVHNVPHQQVSQEGSSIFRSPRSLRPQLGLGAVTRQPAAKARVQQTGQRSALAPSQSAQAAGESTQGYQDSAGELCCCKYWDVMKNESVWWWECMIYHQSSWDKENRALSIKYNSIFHWD